MSALIAQLVGIVGPAHVLQSAEALAPYLTDWRKRYIGNALCVVRPASTEELAAVVTACAAAGVAMVPQGGNTGLVGGGIPHAGEVLISTARMNRIRYLDADNNTITVEAGCILQHVQEAAAAANRLFPLSLAAEGSATIGGNLSTNAGGVQVLRYGNMRELALGLEVVLPDGRIWHGLRGLRKDNTGYDLKHLFIGAEGTLGFITAAVLKLFPKPQAQLTAWVAVPSPAAAVKLLSRLREHCGERVTAFELIGQNALDLVFKHIRSAVNPLPAQQGWQVLVEMSDAWASSPLGTLLEETLALAIEEGLVFDAAIASSGAQADALWHIRESIPEAQKLEGFSIKHDVSVPVSSIPEFIIKTDAALDQVFPGVRVVCFGHVGDGNLHYNLSQSEGAENTKLLAQSADANRIVHDQACALGGSISAEHGIGQLKQQEILRYKSALEMSLMQRVKDAFDPVHLMNPGKLLAK